MVTFAGADDEEGRTATLRRAVAASMLMTTAADGGSAAACIYRLPARAIVEPGAPVPQAGLLTEPRWAVVGAAGDLLMPLQPLDAIDAVVDNLERIAKHRQALAIENPDPHSRLRGRFTVDVQRLGSDRKSWTVATAPPEGGQIVLDEGDIVRVVVRSRHDADVFVALYDFGLSGAIGQIYPARGAQEKLRANGELKCRPQQLGFPDVFPFVASSTGDAALEGIETVKLFVTEQPTDFSGLEQDSLRTSATPMSPLATLLSSVFSGATTRDETPVPLGDEDWTTVAVPFVLRRRTAVAAPSS